MECAKWVEEGLLFTSNELDREQTHAFKIHLDQCPTCKKEFDEYKHLHTTYFTAQILGQSPSEATSREILRVCSHPAKITATFGFFSLIRKGALATALLLVGFFGVGYVAFLANQSTETRQAAIKTKQTAPAAATTVATSVSQSDTDTSKTADSLRAAQAVQKVGNMATEGVTAVTLEKE
jgi:anti-sigma factor RsiW